MKIRRELKLFISTILILLFSFPLICAYSINIPNKLRIKTARMNLYEVEYDTFYITARKMYAVDRDETVYCLDIDEDYPSGDIFNERGDIDKSLQNIINAGYPNRSYENLRLNNSDKAYFATQVAIWCKVEGYNVNKIKGDKDLVNAIKSIYNSGSKNEYSSNVLIKKYIPENKSIQRAIVIFKNDEYKDESINEEKPNIPSVPQVPPKPEVNQQDKPNLEDDSSITDEEEAENIQPNYPPQEG